MIFPTDINLLGISVNLYDLFTVLGFVGALTLAFVFSEKYGLNCWMACFFTVAAFVCGRVWMLFLYWVENGFSGWGGNNIVRVFVWLPVISYPLCKLLKLEWKRICDFIAPIMCSIQGISHWGCIFAGCCHGYPSSWGIYSREVDCVTFPSQPLEAFIATGICIYLLCSAHQRKYRITGLDYPKMLMLFGYSRFLLEFLRDNDKVLFGCISGLAIHAMVAGVVGTVWLYFGKKRVAVQPEVTTYAAAKSAAAKNRRKNINNLIPVE